MMDGEGLLKNMGGLIDATTYKGEDSFVNPNVPEARGGDTVKAIGPDKNLFDTKYLYFNEFIGVYQLYIRAFSNLSDGANAIVTEHWKKDAEGNEILISSEDTWVDTLARIGGLGIGRGYFHENNQHRIIIKTSKSLSETDYIELDYVKLMPIDLWSVSSPLYKYNQSYDVPALMQVRKVELTITGDGSSDTYTVTYNLPFETVSYWVTPAIYESAGKIFPVVINVTGTSFTVAATHKSSNWSGSVNVVCTIFSFETPMSL